MTSLCWSVVVCKTFISLTLTDLDTGHENMINWTDLYSLSVLVLCLNEFVESEG